MRPKSTAELLEESRRIIEKSRRLREELKQSRSQVAATVAQNQDARLWSIERNQLKKKASAVEPQAASPKT
jgi:hypothetical protein